MYVDQATIRKRHCLECHFRDASTRHNLKGKKRDRGHRKIDDGKNEIDTRFCETDEAHTVLYHDSQSRKMTTKRGRALGKTTIERTKSRGRSNAARRKTSACVQHTACVGPGGGAALTRRHDVRHRARHFDHFLRREVARNVARRAPTDRTQINMKPETKKRRTPTEKNAG